jgi:hypothetical protein
MSPFRTLLLSSPSKGSFQAAEGSQDAKLKLFDFNTLEMLSELSLSRLPETASSMASSTALSPLGASLKLETEWELESGKEHYRKLFADLHSQLGKPSPQGPVQKLVGSLGLTGRIQNYERVRSELFEHLTSIIVDSSSGAVSSSAPGGKSPQFLKHVQLSENGELSVGCSPEILFRYEASQKQIHTVAIAGTALSSNGTSLLDDPKERAEHDWVLEGLKLQSSEWAEFESGKTEVVELGNGLSHLKTQVTLHPTWPSEPTDIAKFLVNSLHPTAALGCFPPRSFALDKLFSGEKIRRHYGAPMCLEFENGDLECWVNIRAFEVDNGGQIFFPIGAGIVQESTFENEWNELLRKRDSVMKSLGLHMAKETLHD